MKISLRRLGDIIGILTYGTLTYAAYKGTGEGLSFASFGLWSLLSWISVYTIVKEKGSPSIPAIYGLGATTMTVVLYFKGRFSWSPMDTFTAVMVIICIILLFKKSCERYTLVLSVFSGTIAGIPYIVMTWQNPELSPIVQNVFFCLSALIAFCGAEGWTLASRLCTGVSAVTNMVLITPWLIRWYSR